MRLLSLLLAATAIACSASEREARSADSAPVVPDTATTAPVARYRGRTIDEWVAQLGDIDDSTRVEARKALLEIGEPAVPPLVRLLDGPSGAMWAQAALALSSMCPATAPAIRRQAVTVSNAQRRALLDTIARAVAHPDSFPAFGEPTRDKRGLPRVECLGRGVEP
jgi:HEAT repeat protein